MGVCTGTLINPRTVIFAAHCVNTRPAEAYGNNGTPFGAWAATGGTPIAFGFNADNLPAVRLWLGLSSGDGEPANPALLHQTNLARALYAVEQVWYDPRSRAPTSCTSATSCFLQADIAIATLDTPAFDIPTWAMLFSPLDGPTHAIITGYGGAGRENQASVAIDWRRRSAENMIAVLGSLNDRNMWLFGSGSITNGLYLYDFRDPNPNYNPAAGRFDFGLYGSDAALPREGTTAGGDSGGPLIVDQRYDRPVTVGVLSGGTRFFGAQAGHRYGTDSFYQPLFLYWDVIVANNPYVYAGNVGGNGDWEDPAHWVQLMDPNYMIDVGGELVNSLPDTPAQGIAGGGAAFGQICFLGDCTTLSGAAPTGDGTPIFIPGGPGSTNFVPNNVTANPAAGVRARYYDVTLSAPGTTSLSSSVTIDRMTLDGETRLHVRSGGSLNVLGEYNQLQGWTTADGLVASGRDMMYLSGLLSGSGTVRAPFTTVVGAIVAPGGGDRVGTLTVDGNLILASASSLFVDVGRGAGDRLTVTGTLALGGGSLVFNKVGAAPRHGDTWTIATAGGGVDGTFGTIYSFQGVLRPELTYNPDNIVATLRAGSLVQIIGQSGPVERAFAQALDQLRGSSYTSLYNIYGIVDLMDGASLAATLRGLAPDTMNDQRSLQERQSRAMLNVIGDRLAMLGTGATGTLSVSGSGALTHALATGRAPAALGVSSMVPGSQGVQSLPRGMTGFVSTSYLTAGNASQAAFNGGQRSWYASMGLEIQASESLTIGSAFGFADGLSVPGLQGRAESRTTQAAAYGSYRLGGGVYVAGLASAEVSRADLERRTATGHIAFDLYGATQSRRYNVMMEAGANLAAGHGLTLTPRASLAYSSYRLDGFRETGGEAALQVDDLRLQHLEARLGATLSGAMRMGGWSLEPQLRADYVRTVAGADDGMRVRFASAPDFAFALPVAGGDRNWAEVRGGLRLDNGRVSFGGAIESSIGREATFRDDRAMAEMTIRF